MTPSNFIRLGATSQNTSGQKGCGNIADFPHNSSEFTGQDCKIHVPNRLPIFAGTQGIDWPVQPV
jgi:hypothetical protein